MRVLVKAKPCGGRRTSTGLRDARGERHGDRAAEGRSRAPQDHRMTRQGCGDGSGVKSQALSAAVPGGQTGHPVGEQKDCMTPYIDGWFG